MSDTMCCGEFEWCVEGYAGPFFKPTGHGWVIRLYDINTDGTINDDDMDMRVLVFCPFCGERLSASTPVTEDESD